MRPFKRYLELFELWHWAQQQPDQRLFAYVTAAVLRDTEAMHQQQIDEIQELLQNTKIETADQRARVHIEADDYPQAVKLAAWLRSLRDRRADSTNRDHEGTTTCTGTGQEAAKNGSPANGTRESG